MPDLPALIWPFFDAAFIIVTFIVLTRMQGLRSFSKMSGYDFGITVAMGSVLASVVVSKETDFVTGLAAMSALFLVQAVLSRRRVSSETVRNAMDNDALLIMKDGEIFEENLHRSRMTHGDLIAKLREANVFRLSDVRFAIFEQTGDVSVLHGHGDVDDAIMQGVQDRH
ncbi:hypothetical protein FIU94_14855 [Sulfitobacter sp. THAF37]|uniref:DUF421 domain-containing protein n=1 Tax=Sulfitobacter sp. THAF37 TaxID=2587855 RepID=UPI0012A954A9|nr:YetF domain-containing protein [Sulfitobacter sp. THAF37]QFT60107.1 hypothetical protein FIU94_14855 [Sulfitobacter sp. THAF37]